MAITCEWKDIVGTMETEEGAKLTLYGGGNVWYVVCDENKNLHDFCIDESHLKNILKDEFNHYNRYQKIRLNTHYNYTTKIAKLITKNGQEVTLYYENTKVKR